MGSPVSLLKVNDAVNLETQISKSLELIDFRFSSQVRNVVIKPNLCYYWNSSTGNTTDPLVVGAIIEIIRRQYGENVNIKIAEADASAMRTKYAFPVLGYSKLAEEKKVGLLNLSEDEFKEVSISINNQEMEFNIPQSLLDADLFINVPKLKVMHATKISCAMKNIYGANAIQRKAKYHRYLDEAIVGINKFLNPSLIIVDGVTALGSRPIKLNLLMASTDTFSIDWVASEIMGFSPSKVPFLRLALHENLGSPKGISIRGESISEFSKIFPKTNNLFENHKWGFFSFILKAYTRLSGDIIPPSLDE
ncbi:DUF362 domain-containing protein [Candidatus Bathyarchaeota archaeon]|nr:DUF362 domain-containing protein [Candidatus Bathyarchaeota archaeon]